MNTFGTLGKEFMSESRNKIIFELDWSFVTGIMLFKFHFNPIMDTKVIESRVYVFSY